MSDFRRPEELNRFRLILKSINNGENIIYQSGEPFDTSDTGPLFDVSAIILSAHIANLTNDTKRVTIKLQKVDDLDNPVSTVTMVRNAAIPPEESLNPFSGRVVLEVSDRFIVETNDPSGDLEIALSVLENANT